MGVLLKAMALTGGTCTCVSQIDVISPVTRKLNSIVLTDQHCGSMLWTCDLICDSKERSVELCHLDLIRHNALIKV